MAFNTVPFHGKAVRVEKNDVKMEYTDGWNLNVNLDMADASRSGQDWKEALPGQAGWNGSFSGQFVAGNTEQKAIFDNIVASTPGAKLTDVKFLLDADTNAFTSDIFITSFSLNPTIGDTVEFTVNFVKIACRRDKGGCLRNLHKDVQPGCMDCPEALIQLKEAQREEEIRRDKRKKARELMQTNLSKEG